MLDANRATHTISEHAYESPAERANDALMQIRLGLGSTRPYYQPQVDVLTLKIERAEALLRRRSYDGEAHFLPGDILPHIDAPTQRMMDAEMRQAGAKQLRIWLKRGIAIPIGINVPPDIIGDDRLRHELKWLLSGTEPRFDIDPRYLRLEVSERTDIANLSYEAAKNLKKLADMGFALELDDIGTGYATADNVAAVKNRFGINFDAGKFDRSYFPQGGESNIEKIKELMHVLLTCNPNMGFVMEGVNTRQQLEALMQMKTDEFPRVEMLAQSFMTGMPMPATELQRQLELEHRVH